MTTFRDLHGVVYIFANADAQRVKVGMTTSDVALRLRDVNDMWLGRKGTCQVCGGRLLTVGWFFPEHIVSGLRCPGGNAPPLEQDAALAETHLALMKDRLSDTSGTEKGSLTRKITTLERRMRLYRDRGRLVGEWRLSAVFYTEAAERVELLSHDFLRKHLDETAPFGEVFCCSESEAMEAVERALSELGLLEAAQLHRPL